MRPSIRVRSGLAAVVVCAALTGCVDAPPTGPAAAAPLPRVPAAVSAHTTAAAGWNALTGDIVSRRPRGPGATARTFALVSVAAYNAVIAAEEARHGRTRPSSSGAVAGAASAVLAALYPMEQTAIDARLAADAAAFPRHPSERQRSFAAGVAIGRQVAAEVLAYAAGDGSTAVWTGTVPVGPGLWVSAPPPAVPVTPLWGEVRPWLMTSGDQFRPAPPPAPGTAEFLAALAEVRHLSDTRTPEQLAIAVKWGALVGTPGPMGYWSEVGLELAAARNWDERRTARMLALVHMAGMDASIGCWDAKYAYWYFRPSQADPAITTPVFLPNFPAYPSAHSCFSAAGAGVLLALFPSAAAELQAGVAEAGEARLYGGVHFRFDVTAGQELGFAVAALALAKGPRGHERIPLGVH